MRLDSRQRYRNSQLTITKRIHRGPRRRRQSSETMLGIAAISLIHVMRASSSPGGISVLSKSSSDIITAKAQLNTFSYCVARNIHLVRKEKSRLNLVVAAKLQNNSRSRRDQAAASTPRRTRMRVRLNDGRTGRRRRLPEEQATRRGLSHTSYLRAVNLDNIDRRLHHSAMTRRQSLLLRRSPCPWQPQTR